MNFLELKVSERFNCSCGTNRGCSEGTYLLSTGTNVYAAT